MPPEIETLVALYAAFNARDVDAVLARLDPAVRWPNGWEGGFLEGHAAVRDYWRRQWAAIDPTVTPERFETLPLGCIRVTVRQVVKDLEGRVLSDRPVAHTYAFSGTRILSMTIGEPDAEPQA